MSISDELQKLQGLRDAGVLTDEEFARAKASVLAALTTPAAAPAVDENSVRVREQLQSFKVRFAAADEADVRNILLEGEDLLIFVCGQSRFNELASAASSVENDVRCSRDRDYEYKDRRDFTRNAQAACEKLKNRIAGIEYRK